MVGLAITIAGIAGAILFFTAPVSVPILAAAGIAGILAGLVYSCGDGNDGRGGDGMASGTFIGIGLPVAVPLTIYTYPIIKEAVYTTAAMTIGGIVTGALAGLGAVIGIGGLIAMRNYEAKILKLRDQYSREILDTAT